MKPQIDALLRFPIFKDFRPDELATVATSLRVVDLAPGEVLFEEGDQGCSMFFLHMGRIQIDRTSTPGYVEVLAELEPPTVIGEMAVLDHMPRSARAVAMRPCVLWEMDEARLEELAQGGNPAAFKIIRWIARSLSDRLRRTNDRLIDIYAKPFKSIFELKERLRKLSPGMLSVGFDQDPAGDS